MVVLGVRGGSKLLDVGSTDLGDGTAAIKVALTSDVEGIATAANQATEIASLQSIDGKLSAAAAAADAAPNATATSSILARAAAYNGAAWDRVRAGVTAISSTVTGFLNAIPMAVYNASPTTRTEGQYGPAQADAQGNLKTTLGSLIAGEDLANNVLATVLQPLATSTHALSQSDSIGVSGVVVKAAAGTLCYALGANRNAATRYIQVHDASAAPADGAAPKVSIPVASGQPFSLDLTPFGRYHATGIYVCSSTTAATKTLGSADMDLSAGYV